MSRCPLLTVRRQRGIARAKVKNAGASRRSAGILLYRRTAGSVEVLLGHPGGPFWRNKDLTSWSIPKGLIGEGESPVAAATHEFAAETGYTPRGTCLLLGEAKQPGGKIVHAWAVEDDWDATLLKSNLFDMEWPPKSGRRQSFPELDRAEWLGIAEARAKILKGQAVFLDRLAAAISGN